MEINVLIDEEFEGDLEADWLRSIAEQVLVAEDAAHETELGLVITDQSRIQELNLVHLDIDEPTDVLAFPMSPEEAIHLGEVIISYPQAFMQAEEHRHPVKKEVALLLIHGVLHLLGYDHDAPEPEQRMKAREAEIMERVEEKGW